MEQGLALVDQRQVDAPDHDAGRRCVDLGLTLAEGVRDDAQALVRLYPGPERGERAQDAALRCPYPAARAALQGFDAALPGTPSNIPRDRQILVCLFSMIFIYCCLDVVGR